MADEEMQPKFFGVFVDKWFEECLPGLSLSPEQLKKVGGFAEVPSRGSFQPNLYTEMVRVRREATYEIY